MNGWTRWFAWYPVKLQFNGYVWLRWVEYKHVSVGGIATMNYYSIVIHYRLPDDAPEFRMEK